MGPTNHVKPQTPSSKKSITNHPMLEDPHTTKHTPRTTHKPRMPHITTPTRLRRRRGRGHSNRRHQHREHQLLSRLIRRARIAWPMRVVALVLVLPRLQGPIRTAAEWTLQTSQRSTTHSAVPGSIYGYVRPYPPIYSSFQFKKHSFNPRPKKNPSNAHTKHTKPTAPTKTAPANNPPNPPSTPASSEPPCAP